MCRLLNSTDGNILLTTGSKDLATYSQNEALKDRLFVRVLPGLESISLCEQNGICGKQIIAMVTFFIGNEPCIDQTVSYKVPGHKGEWQNRWISGKIKAAGAEGITACVIGNPEKQNSGDTFTQVCRKISKITGKTIKTRSPSSEPVWEMSRRSRWKRQKNPGSRLHFRSRTAAKDHKNEQAVRYPYYLAADIIPELNRLSGCGVKVVILFPVIPVFTADAGNYMKH